MTTKAHQRNMFVRIIAAPIKALGKARDFYVRSITNCSDRVGYGGMAGMGGVHGAPLPRSFSAASSSRSSDYNDDFQELLRAASSRSLGNKIDVDLYLKQQILMQQQQQNSRKMPRSTTVAMGRIDEETPFTFGEDNVDVKAEAKYPRSRSYVPTKRGVVF